MPFAVARGIGNTVMQKLDHLRLRAKMCIHMGYYTLLLPVNSTNVYKFSKHFYLQT